MIDIHCHILPDIDDGARDLETAIRMCHLAQANGIKHIVATPHTNTVDNIDHFIKTRDERLQLLRKHIADRGIDIKLYPGAEVFVDDDIFFANDLKRLTINGSRYILIEFNFRNVHLRKIYDYLNEIIDMGLVPIIAHPERYEFFQFDYDAVNSLAKNGVIFQINATSLASLDGLQEFELAYSMAYNGLASLIGTDAHSLSHRATNLSEMMRYFPPDISQYNMQMMVHDSAKAVLTDNPIPMAERREIHKRGSF
ncbi:MAG: CpsB/CapC family capsule biosynthesis tyrosine phosphatase [Acutalibacteraceae bacterium]|jgi:protein-tyrosine phosphatase|nr:CpsB/CapC family capsule biosynthesis tyrosine phosphatase [Acutalibacteraceae bacterium]